MTTAIGTTLAHYRITGTLGAGGMGEVYRAVDTRLDRQVAIKLLPPVFAGDAERLARIGREAKLLAQLHHPNIASIFGLEETDRGVALVMELVEGEDLAQTIARGPLPVDDALAIARQIAEALEAAHEQGIVHRDLKPANVKVRPDGAVKVLDFGLAKAMDTASGVASATGGPVTSPVLMNSPTLTSAGTQLGMILGTAAYMAPEQARGKSVDRRADIWAFGVVLWEMLTGRRLFAGEETSDVLAAVLRQDVALDPLPVEVPARVRHLLQRCLDRDPKRRLRDIGEARLVLAGEDPAELAPAPTEVVERARPSSRWMSMLALAGVALVAAAAAWMLKAAPRASTVRLSIALPSGEQVTSPPAISPDGQTIAYVAGKSDATARLYLRGLDDFTPRAVDSGIAARWPVFSPDGRFVAFVSGGKLRRAAVGGGAATELAVAPRSFGVSWSADGWVYYAPMLNGGIWRVRADGGTLEQVTRPDDGEHGYAHTFPQALPGGDVLFAVWGKRFDAATVTPATRRWRWVTEGGKSSRTSEYVDRYLLRGDRSGSILAAAWSPAVGTTVQPDTTVLDDVYWISGIEKAYLDVASNGTVVYVPGSQAARRLVWVDRAGAITDIPGDPDLILGARLSPDGRRALHTGGNALWVRDLVTGARTPILTGITWAYAGGWFPAGDRVVFSSNKSGEWDLYTARVGGGEPVQIHRPGTQHPMDVASDGTIVFVEYSPTTGVDIWKLSPAGVASPLVVTPYQDTAAAVSPDARWVAYMSDESGRNEVYAVPLSGQGDRVVVSSDGGTGPVWSRDGKELFYRNGDDLVSVAVLSTAPLQLGTRHRVLDVSGLESQYVLFREMEPSPDGQRFLYIRSDPDARPTRLNVILNWFPELEQKVKTR